MSASVLARGVNFSSPRAIAEIEFEIE